ncbi:MAG: ankyrin repeat domain-containing protein [Gammaproteobacteria bacterium]|nr:ankyrin repeat domain-containing protein [Gammaproteobacteria bacterium]
MENRNLMSNDDIITQAIISGDDQRIKNIIDMTPELFEETDENDLTFLHLAIEYNQIEIIKYIVDSGIDLYLGEPTPLEYANRLELDEIAIILSQSLIHKTVSMGDLDGVETLLHLNPRLLEQRSCTGQTPLIMAVIHHNTEIIKFLVARGANLKVSLYSAQTEIKLVDAARKSGCTQEIIDLFIAEEKIEIDGEAKKRAAMMIKEAKIRARTNQNKWDKIDEDDPIASGAKKIAAELIEKTKTDMPIEKHTIDSENNFLIIEAKKLATKLLTDAKTLTPTAPDIDKKPIVIRFTNEKTNEPPPASLIGDATLRATEINLAIHASIEQANLEKHFYTSLTVNIENHVTSILNKVPLHYLEQSSYIDTIINIISHNYYPVRNINENYEEHLKNEQIRTIAAMVIKDKKIKQANQNLSEHLANSFFNLSFVTSNRKNKIAEKFIENKITPDCFQTIRDLISSHDAYKKLVGYKSEAKEFAMKLFIFKIKHAKTLAELSLLLSNKYRNQQIKKAKNEEKKDLDFLKNYYDFLCSEPGILFTQDRTITPLLKKLEDYFLRCLNESFHVNLFEQDIVRTNYRYNM